MASGLYTSFKTGLMNGTFNLASDTINVALLNNSFSFVAATTTFSNTDEISGTGYTAGGQALSGLSVSASGTSAVWTASNVTWTSSTFNAYFAEIYDVTASNKSIACIDFGGEVSVSGGTFEIEWSGSGIISLA